MESTLLPPMAASQPTGEAPPLPTTMRRPRRKAREVSSRYMMTPSPSPMPAAAAAASSSSSSPLHSSSSLFHHQQHPPKHRRSPSAPSSPEATDSEPEPPSRFADQNQPLSRSLETPVFLGGVQNKILGTQRKRAMRLFGDNGDHQSHHHHHHHHQPLEQQQPKPQYSRKLRPGTPMACCPVDRTAATPKGAILGSTQLRAGRNAAAKVGRSEGFVQSRRSPFRSEETSSENSSSLGDSEVEACSTSGQGGFCDSPPIIGSRVRQASAEFRSSMPEADLLPSMSSRRILDGGSSLQSDANENSCCRSLNLALSSSQQNPFALNKPPGRYIPSKICLPPQPPSSKLDGELKKGKKGSSRQEEVHTLRLLHNRYLQWRFVNANAREAVDARTAAAEKSLYGLSAKISEMQDSAMEKRSELERLKRSRSISTILEFQMPYLDKWSTLEGDYSSCLTGVTKALQDASLRLPIAGNVRADIKDLKEVFDSTANIFESLSPCIQRFTPKAEAVEDVASDLAELVSTERALIEECGNLLSEAHNLQVIESSLRSQLIQTRRGSGVRNQENL